MKLPPLRRRSLLTGLGASSLLGLPLFNRMVSAADGDAPPKRLVLFFTSNNALAQDFWGLDGLSDGDLLPNPTTGVLGGLSDFRDRLTVIHDLDGQHGEGGHDNMTQIATGTHDTVGDGVYSTGTSFDTTIARGLGFDEPLVLGAWINRGSPSRMTYLSYLGGGQPAVPIDDPMAAFDVMLGGVSAETTEAALRDRRLKKSMLDAMTGDLQRLHDHVPPEDRAKLELHLDAVRGIEEQLENSVVCDPEALIPEDGYDYQSSKDFPRTLRMHIDIATQVLACNVHQVVTLQFGQNGPVHIYPTWPEYGIDYDFNEHRIGHREDMNGNDVGDQPKIDLETWFHTFALRYLLEKLDSIPEGDGTLLDNTLVVRFHSFGSTPNGVHSGPIPYVLAGGAGGAFETGRFRRLPGHTNCDLYVSLCQAFGLTDVESFGDPEKNTSPIAL
jgi:hypothetical protein